MLDYILVFILLRSSSSLFLEDPSQPIPFKFSNIFSEVNNVSEIELSLKSCLGVDVARNIYLYFQSASCQSLQNAAKSSITASQFLIASHKLNSCCTGNVTSEQKKLYLYVALASWPWNQYAAKNLAYIYEWNGRYRAASDLYHQVRPSSFCLCQSNLNLW